MYKFIFSFKHSIGAYYNLYVNVNADGIVEYEYSYCPRYVLDSNLVPEHVKNVLNKEVSKQFIDYLNDAQISNMEERYFELPPEILHRGYIDNHPDCYIALIDNCESYFITMELDSYPDTFKYIIKALDLISKNLTYYFRNMEKELN